MIITTTIVLYIYLFLKLYYFIANGEWSKQESSVKSYPLAIKMMFNYDAESNAMSILRAMSRETVPSRCIIHDSSRTDQQWLIGYIIF